MTDLFGEWEARLEAEGLGVICPHRERSNASTDIKHIKGKYKRLDALLNDPDPSARMTNSPVTARAVETRFIAAGDEHSVDFDDGLHDLDEDADNAFDLLLIGFVATPKEAELADRQRAACFGLDDFGRPRSSKVYRKRGETDEQYRERVAERLGIATDEMGPVYSPYRPPAPEFASSDAGSGPLAMVTRPKPDRGSPRREEELRPSPVVDTDGYLPGRSPFQRQLAQRGVRNSDITG